MEIQTRPLTFDEIFSNTIIESASAGAIISSDNVSATATSASSVIAAQPIVVSSPIATLSTNEALNNHLSKYWGYYLLGLVVAVIVFKKINDDQKQNKIVKTQSDS